MKNYLAADGLRILMGDSDRTEGIIIYLADLKNLSENVALETRHLSDEENYRSARIRNPQQGKWFRYSRWLLRKILAYHGKLQANQIQFQTGARGKPCVPDLPFSFNASRSSHYHAIGISYTGQIGVDLEYNPSLETVLEVSQNVFTENEKDCFSKCNDEEKMKYFLRLWTLKEAILKATGNGLVRGMREIGFREDGTGPRLEALPRGYGLIQDWELGLVGTGTKSLCCAYACCKLSE